jgi:hypothetical protein
MPRSKVELFAADKAGLAIPPPHPIDADTSRPPSPVSVPARLHQRGSI